jgi:hypothetical protein
MLFRPDDSKPLALDEDDEWVEMQAMGRRRYVVRRTASMLAHVILPVVGLSWSVWWASPGARSLLFGRVTWIGLAIGIVLVGSLTAAHAWDTWRSYERRDKVEDSRTPAEALRTAFDRPARQIVAGAVLGTLAFGIGLFGGMPWWLTTLFGVSAAMGWRAAYFGWRAKKAFHALPDTLQ